MIHWAALSRLFGYLLLGISAALLGPLAYAGFVADDGFSPLLWSTLAGLAAGGSLAALFRRKVREISRREGTLFVVLAWVGVSVLGALPFYLSDHVPGYADAFFESISGFTTTGATILGDVDALPRSLLLWRAVTQWIGGMGVILLGIAVLPLLGAGGMELYRADFPGARSEKLKPRVVETARSLWTIYVGFSLAEYLCLRLAGMGRFDAICHSMTTISTGGFSSRTRGIEAFQSPAIETVVVLFMLVAAINFTCHYRLLVQRDPGSSFRDVEIRGLFGMIAVCTAAVTTAVAFGESLPLTESFRPALFQVVSIVTTTGFSSTNYAVWSSFSLMLLLWLMFVGGCTGSTAGGIKVFRVLLLFQVMGRQLRRMAERHAVFAVRFGGGTVSKPTVSNLFNLIYLAALLYAAACLALTALGADILTSASAVAAAMFNVGPGLAGVGPAEHYGHLPWLAKWILSFCMLAGRLEFYAVLVLVAPAFWRK